MEIGAESRRETLALIDRTFSKFVGVDYDKGIERRLLEAAAENISLSESGKIDVNSSSCAMSFYERLGFTIVFTPMVCKMDERR